jgi:Leucine rich repeat
LKHFNVNDNQIEAIDGDLFTFNPRILEIGLWSNKITNVGPNVFNSLGSLRDVDLGNNLCVNWRANNDANSMRDLKRRLNHACPPTADMVERIVVDGSKLANKVDGRFDTRFNSKFNPSFDTRFETKFSDKIKPVFDEMTESIDEMTENFEDHQSKIRRLEIRVSELELIIMEIDAKLQTKEAVEQ